jgi:hypothetical protein
MVEARSYDCQRTRVRGSVETAGYRDRRLATGVSSVLSVSARFHFKPERLPARRTAVVLEVGNENVRAL